MLGGYGRVLAPALALVAVGCGAEEPKLTLGDQCDLTSQCEAPLVCRIGRCRIECATLRDCPVGTLCVTDGDGLGACSLSGEDGCEVNSDCPDPLVCRMGRCTNACADDRDCPAGSVCEGEGAEAACVDPADEACVLDSECPEPLRCAADRRCRAECRSSRDCRVGAVCRDGSCMPPDEPADGGFDAGTDAGTSMDASVTVDGGTDAGAATDAGSGWDSSWIWRDAAADAGWDGALPECSAEMPCPSYPPPNATVECVGGRCTITGCTAPWADCNGVGVDGCETNTDTHRDHCSACGSACPSGQACLAGACVGATATSVDVGEDFACAAWSTGEVTCWGENDRGQLGNGEPTSADRPVPVMVSGLDDVVAVDAEYLHVCALRSDHTVWCWGYNFYGQLGDGTTTNRSVPTQVSGLTDAAAISVGQFTTCALRTGGAVSCWGQNNQGQVGNGTAGGAETTPVAVVGLTDATQVSAGETSCALRSTGALACWGANANHQIDDSGLPRWSPTDVMSFGTAGFTPAFVRGGISVVVAAGDGRGACQGTNSVTQFQCGVGHPENPVHPPEAQPGVTEAVAADGTCWVTSSGGVQCWGKLNQYGAAGIGRAEYPHATPVSAVGVSDVVEVGSSEWVSCARTAGGSVLCTGYGSATGDGTGGTRYTFRRVEGTP